MGRSTPTFMVPACAAETHDPNGSLGAVDYNEPSTIRAVAEVYKKRSLRCWNHDDFKMEIKDSNGILKNYHFLEYSGTRQLAEDIERVRQVFGDQKLSVYGISYGTKVFGTYATMFPENVNLMVLDGNIGKLSALIIWYSLKKSFDILLTSKTLNSQTRPWCRHWPNGSW